MPIIKEDVLQRNTSAKIACENCLANWERIISPKHNRMLDVFSLISFFRVTERQLRFRTERVPGFFWPRWGVMWQQCCSRKAIGWDFWTVLYYTWQLRDGKHSFHPVNKKRHIALWEGGKKKKGGARVFQWDISFWFAWCGALSDSACSLFFILAMPYCSWSLLYFVIWYWCWFYLHYCKPSSLTKQTAEVWTTAHYFHPPGET